MAKGKLTKGRYMLDYENGIAHSERDCPGLRKSTSTAIGSSLPAGFTPCWRCISKLDLEGEFTWQ